MNHRVKLFPENIPSQLTTIPQWICYRRVPSKKDPTKMDKLPICSKNGQMASVDNPQSWGSFEQALSKYQHDMSISGIGLVLTQDLGLVGIDFDGCLREDGSFIWGEDDIEKIDTYTEISPSGRGIRIFAFGTLPTEGRKKGQIELYNSGRFLTVTGNVVDPYRSIQCRQPEITALHKRVFTKKTETAGDKKNKNTKKGRGEDASHHKNFSDADAEKIIGIIGRSKMADLFHQLFIGDWKGAWGGKQYPSQSEADLALLGILAFFTKKDPDLMKHIFKKSKLYHRTKCEKKHRPDGATYLEMTVEEAINGCSNVYSPQDSTKGMSLQDYLEDLNKKYAVSMLGNRCVVIDETGDIVTFLRMSDFQQFHQNLTCKIENSDDTEKTVAIVKVWLKWGNRRQYPRIEFKPGISNTNSYNLWRGFSIIAKPGDWSLMQYHIEKVVCQGIERYYRYVYSWIARIYQHPGSERPGVALVIRGKQGTGKGLFARFVGAPLGKQHFVHVVSPHHFSGRFNSHLQSCLLLFADEAFCSENKESIGILKGLVTEPTVMIEGKGKDAFEIDNFINVIAAGNSSFIVPAGEAERRFCVLDISDVHIQDVEYFKKLCDQMNSGGVEAMFHDLLRYDISGFNFRDFPRSNALFDQQLRGLNPVSQWWLECLKFGTLNSEVYGKVDLSSWERRIFISHVLTYFQKFLDQINNKTSFTPTLFGRELKKVCPAIERRRDSQDDRVYRYEFPPLDECRQLFCTLMKYDIKWDDF